MRFSAFIALALILLTGCVHHTPYSDEYYFQALGEPSEIVITADLDKLKEGRFSELIPSSGAVGYVMDRSERLSLSLNPKALDRYPLAIEDYIISGGVEGNLGKFTINTALSFSKDFEKAREDGLKYYTNGSVSLSVPENGILLFTDGSFSALYDRTIENRVKLIDDETASLMAASVFAVFLDSPETLLDLGFELPDTVIKQIVTSYLTFGEVEGSLILSGRMMMDGKSSARALTTLLRNQLIQDAKRSGAKIDIKVLSSYFNYAEDVITISDFPLPDDMASRAEAMIKNALEGLI